MVLGSEKDTVVVGVVSGATPDQTQVFSFPIRSDTQDGFSAFPIRIKTWSLVCQTDEGALPGCKSTKGCRSFTVVDNECDGFNFYWDSSRKALAWWRH